MKCKNIPATPFAMLYLLGGPQATLCEPWFCLEVTVLWMYFIQGAETPSGERISYSLGSANSFQLDRIRELNQRRMRVLDDMREKERRSGERETESAETVGPFIIWLYF